MSEVKRKKTGPRPKPAALVRNAIVRVMLTPAEFDTIRRRAGHGSMSAYLRDRGLSR